MPLLISVTNKARVNKLLYFLLCTILHVRLQLLLG
jgi:hypothetical protein